MKKKLRIFIVIISILSIFFGLSVCIVNKKINDLKKEALNQHRELFSNYEGMEYKEYKVFYLGIYDGYIGLFFDEMDKEKFFKYSEYVFKGQILFYKDGKLLNETSKITDFILKEKTKNRLALDFNKLMVKEFILYKNRI